MTGICPCCGNVETLVKDAGSLACIECYWKKAKRNEDPEADERDFGEARGEHYLITA